ncbi:MAG: hypothetical protein K0S99_419, partial [Thermomicrobiales bacterium]|nr:hypothetical protein [Thermomicrobiales bacterium]
CTIGRGRSIDPVVHATAAGSSLVHVSRHLGVSAQGSQRLLPGACDRGRLPGLAIDADATGVHRSFVEQPYRRERPVVAEIEQPHSQRCSREQGVADIRQCGDLAVGGCEGNVARQRVCSYGSWRASIRQTPHGKIVHEAAHHRDRQSQFGSGGTV